MKASVVEHIFRTEQDGHGGIALFKNRFADFVGAASGHVMVTLQMVVETTGLAFAAANVMRRKDTKDTVTSQWAGATIHSDRLIECGR